MKTVTLREVAQSRAGEKGDDVQLSVIAYRDEDYALIRDQITADVVARRFGKILIGGIDRYEVPGIAAINFVLHNVLGGGRSRTIAFEESGKSLSSVALQIPIEVPDDYIGRAERVRQGEPAI
ncbi:AtuA-related protein [Microbacterium sp. BR1]|uniref:AtuA-related protein n=1 Tax=Microbacterium sp. BR1 TaxID=1070896 RepID=UPI000C2C903C|nr:hypothetical protein [Microbacterium sp. BR1]